MYKIGITGSIGMGKSTIAKMFSVLGIPIHDADEEVQKLLKKKEVLTKIRKRWPKAVKKGALNKNFLRDKIFQNKTDKKDLEDIMHPLVEKKRKEFEENNVNNKILVYDVPLIFETNTQKKYDLIILANCSNEVQKLRVLKRKNINEYIFNKINQTQLSFNKKKKYNPIIINTMRPKILTFLRIFFITAKIRLEKSYE